MYCPQPNKDVRPHYGILCFGNAEYPKRMCFNTYLGINTYLKLESIHTLEQWTVKLYPLYDRTMQVSVSSQK